MSLLELFFIAVGLSMDAFAVSLCKGLVMDRLRTGDGLLVALFFGGFLQKQGKLIKKGKRCGHRFPPSFHPTEEFIFLQIAPEKARARRDF